MRDFTPHWFIALRKFCWSVRSISREFDVPPAIARDMQHSFPTFPECCAIARASSELTSQVGH